MDYAENRKEYARRFFPSDMNTRSEWEQNVIESYCMYHADGTEVDFRMDPVFNDELIVTCNDGRIYIFDISDNTLRCVKWEDTVRDSTWRKEFGSRLQKMIWSRRLTQYQFAELVGITPGALSTYIRGKTIPGLYIASKMARVLECNIDDLLVNA